MNTSEFDAKWPNACRKCGGRGEVMYSDDPSAAGVSLSPGSMEFVETCPACLEMDKCPLCGNSPLWGDDEETCCWECGWYLSSTEDDYFLAPYRPEEPSEPDPDQYRRTYEALGMILDGAS